MKAFTKIDQKEIIDIELIDLYLIVCNYFKVNINQVNQVCKDTELVRVRQAAHYLACKHTNFSLSQIGRVIGGKDHCTVMHSSKTVENTITPLKNGFIQDRKMAKDIAILKFKLQKKVNAIEDEYYNTIGSLVSYKNYSES